MIWWEFADDCGDGTIRMLRFKTEEEANAAREKADKYEYFQGDGDGSPVQKIDTDSTYFFEDPKELFND